MKFGFEAEELFCFKTTSAYDCLLTFIATCQTKWSLAAYLEAAVVPSFVLEKGCGQLRRIWCRSTGRKSLEKVSEDACVVVIFMNPLKLILIKRMK